MSVKRSLLVVFVCGALLGCGSGGTSAPAPVGTQDPAPDPQQPKTDPQNPSPDSETPLIGAQEPPLNADAPAPPSGEGGASADDD